MEERKNFLEKIFLPIFLSLSSVFLFVETWNRVRWYSWYLTKTKNLFRYAGKTCKKKNLRKHLMILFIINYDFLTFIIIWIQWIFPFFKLFILFVCSICWIMRTNVTMSQLHRLVLSWIVFIFYLSVHVQ